MSQILLKYFTEHPPNTGDANSILDMIYWHFTEYNCVDNKKIRAEFDRLRDIINLPPHQYDVVFSVVSDLCLEHGKLAFVEGLRFAFLMMQELECI